MGKSRALVILLLVGGVAGSGCFELDPAGDSDDSGSEQPPTTVPNNPVVYGIDGAAWNATGAPGSWAVILYDYPFPAAPMDFRLSFDAAGPSSGASTDALVVHPREIDEHTYSHPFTIGSSALYHNTGPVARSGTGGISSGTPQLMAAVAASTEWTLRLEVIYDEGGADKPIFPSRVIAGSNATFWFSSDPPTPSTAHLIEASIPTAGWTHIQFVNDRPTTYVEHSQLDFSIEFGNGERVEGNHVYVSARGNPHDMVGAFNNAPGMTRAEYVSQASPAIATLAAVHLPIEFDAIGDFVGEPVYCGPTCSWPSDSSEAL